MQNKKELDELAIAFMKNSDGRFVFGRNEIILKSGMKVVNVGSKSPLGEEVFFFYIKKNKTNNIKIKSLKDNRDIKSCPKCLHECYLNKDIYFCPDCKGYWNKEQYTKEIKNR